MRNRILALGSFAGICVGLVVTVSAHAVDARRLVFLRNDARLVQVETAGGVNLRCERMGDVGNKANRWVKDCNDLARVALNNLAKSDRLADKKVERTPFGGEANGIVLQLDRATKGGEGLADQ